MEGNLQEKIEKLIATSSVSEECKQHTLRLLPMMTPVNLEKVYKALTNESSELAKIAEEEKRLKFKYQMYIDKLSELKGKEKI